MTGLHRYVLFASLLMLPFAAIAEDRLVRVYAPEVLIETGLFKFIVPRFSLKTQVRVELVEIPEDADVVLGAKGQALFHGKGQTWHMRLRDAEHNATKRFAGWLGSDVGQRTVFGYAPDGETIFGPPQQSARAVAVLEFDGDAALGLDVSRTKCVRCHRVDDEHRMTGIGSTPSFAVLRSLPDWQERFAAFYVLNPHPAFTVIADVTEPFPIDRPSPIHPVTMTLDEVEAVLAYVAAMDAADLGAPLAHQ